MPAVSQRANWRWDRSSRYALPGLPAGLLLLAAAVARLPRWGMAALLVLVWVPEVRAMYAGSSRPEMPFPEIASAAERGPVRSDLVIIDSIPSSVVGIARYLRSEVPTASWVVRLGQRQMPGAMTDLVPGCCRVALVKMHRLFPGVEEKAPAEVWLGANATLEARTQVSPPASNAEVLDFRLEGVAESSCAEKRPR